jgi:hypothetical protein
MKKVPLVIVGAIFVLLGGLWLVQGLGVSVPPILCFAECEPLEGASRRWAVIGCVMIIIGALAILYALRRRPGS